MHLIATEYGRFAGIDQINSNFRNDRMRLKLTLDTESPRKLYLDQFPQLLFSVLEIFPNLRSHRCQQGESGFTKREYDLSHLVTPIKIIGDVIDTVHLLEHVILEMQCQIGIMDECSGLTCNYWEPENRYDVFIECDEPELGLFSCNASLDLFRKLLYGSDTARIDIADMLAVAAKIYHAETDSIAALSEMLAWRESKITRIMERLEELSFPFHVLQPAA